MAIFRAPKMVTVLKSSLGHFDRIGEQIDV